MRSLGKTLAPPVLRPEIGVLALDTGTIYSDWISYRKAFPAKKAAGRVALLIYSASNTPEGRAALRTVAAALEREDLEVVTLFGNEPEVIRKLMLDRSGRSRFDLAAAFSFKFKAGLNEEL